MPKKFKDKVDAEIHKDLKGFEIKINEFGELESNLSIDKINDFLNKQKVGQESDVKRTKK